MTREPVRMDLVRTLDEQKTSSSLVYEAMHAGALLVLDGAPFRTADGRIDRARFLARLTESLNRTPEWGMRLMPAPLGVTTPAWVPDERFNPARHVHFEDDAVELTAAEARRLIGYGAPVLPRDRPLWDMWVASLTTGQIAVGVRMHHVVGDGEWGFDVLRRLTSDEPEAVDPHARTQRSGRAPRSSFAVPVHALRAFVAAQPSWRAGWREYWRKPFLKRAKRVVMRNATPVTEWWIARKGLRAKMLPPTQGAAFDLDASATVRHAARLRGTVNDLLVASAMGAVDDDERGLDMLVPVSRRRRKGGSEGVRNHISMARVHMPRGATLAERVTRVRTTVRDMIRGEEKPQETGRMLGYATIMSFSDTPRWFGDARVERFIVFPVGDPRSELSAFGVSYAGTLAVTLVTRLELDVEAMAASMHDDLTGASSATEPDGAAPGEDAAVDATVADAAEPETSEAAA